MVHTSTGVLGKENLEYGTVMLYQALVEMLQVLADLILDA
jgi:hypothetical protein